MILIPKVHVINELSIDSTSMFVGILTSIGPIYHHFQLFNDNLNSLKLKRCSYLGYRGYQGTLAAYNTSGLAK